MAGMTVDLKDNMQTYRTGAIRLRNRDFGKYERLNPTHLVVRNGQAIMNILEEQEEISSLSPRINFMGAYTWDDKLKNVMGVAVDFQREEGFQNISEVLVAGRLPTPGTSEALVGVKMAQKLGVNFEDDLEDKITIVTTTAQRRKKLFTIEIVGIAGFPMSALNDAMVLIPLDRAQDLLRMPDAYSEILIKVDEDVVDVDLYTPQLAELLPLETEREEYSLELKSWKEDNTIWGMMSMAQAMYMIFAFFFFVLGSSVIINTTMMVIFERMREIGTLAAMGMRGRELTKLFFLEAFFISFFGALAGLIVGMIITQIFHVFGLNLGAMMEGIDFDISTIIYPQLDLFYTAFTFVFAVLVASLATFIPSIRASRIEPVDALRA
jgi:putative ABC transport system permease protein